MEWFFDHWSDEFNSWNKNLILRQIWGTPQSVTSVVATTTSVVWVWHWQLLWQLDWYISFWSIKKFAKQRDACSRPNVSNWPNFSTFCRTERMQKVLYHACPRLHARELTGTAGISFQRMTIGPEHIFSPSNNYQNTCTILEHHIDSATIQCCSCKSCWANKGLEWNSRLRNRHWAESDVQRNWKKNGRKSKTHVNDCS